MIYAMERGFLAEYLARRGRVEKAPDINVLFDLFEGQQVEEEQEPPKYKLIESEAHLQISGVLSRQRSWIDWLFGMAASLTYDEIAEAMIQADEDPAVETIVLDIDSPGGYVDGVDVASQAIADAEKPVEARVDNMATSAAYWLASQADEIFALSPAARIGSIGVVATVPRGDSDEFEIIGSADAPVKEDLYHPETKAGRAAWKKQLADLHQAFASRVAEGRGVPIDTVNSDFGRGAVVMAAAAIEADMIDGMAHIELWGPNCKRKKKKKKSSAVAEVPGVAGEHTAAKADGTKTGRGTIMTLEELKRGHPDVYAAVLAAGREVGVVEERKRVEKLMAWADADPACETVVAEAIAKGQDVDDAMPQIHAAIRKARESGQASRVENPPEVATAVTATGSGESAEADEKQVEAILAKIPKV